MKKDTANINSNIISIVPFCRNKIKRNKLFILIGIPCSGKTYYSEKYLVNKDTTVVSTDDIRKETYGFFIYNERSNKVIIKKSKEILEQGLIDKYNVIYDATNTNKTFRKSIVRIGKKYNAEIIGIVFNTNIDICLDRNNKRPKERRVPEDIIKMMSNYNHDIDKIEEKFDQIIIIN